MARILVEVEGETEETFVKELLAPHLFEFGHHVTARLLGNARSRSHRGGIRSWPSARRDIVRHLREDAEVVVTTMVDYYGLPKTGDRAWPGRNLVAPRTAERERALRDALSEDVRAAMGRGFDPQRFLPFVLMYEFEALLFADCAAFARGIARPDLEAHFAAIRSRYASPEEINDSPITAPSKQIMAAMPSYQKPFHGILALLEIGLPVVRAECPLFGAWIDRLEEIP